MYALFLAVVGLAAADTNVCVSPPVTTISREHPLIFLQVSAAFGDTDEAPAGSDRPAEADRHGREIVRLWNLLPEDIRDFCQLQVELRVRDHDLRLELFRRMLREPERAGVRVSVQIADPDDIYVFDPGHAERLLDEFSCVRSLMLSEQQFAHYADFNVASYATPPHTRYTCDIIKLAAKHGRHTVIVLQGLKWLHITADTLNQPLLDTMRAYSDYLVPVNEHIEARHLARQTATWGLWLGGYASQWGIEPQSWWFESSFMNGAGKFGDHIHPLEMPPGLYRAMILQGAAMGATVYSFEPWWDLLDCENHRCWDTVILPTLREVLGKHLIPSREQVLAKTAIAYQVAPAQDINEFHQNLRDLDWLSDEGNLAKAAYGVWQPMLEFELIPNNGNWFIPLLPPGTPKDLLANYSCVLQPGQCDSVAGWTELLRQHAWEARASGAAWTCSINGHAFVMQSHENLYERQTYTLRLPKPVRGLKASLMPGKGLRLEWPADPGARRYFVAYAEGNDDDSARTRLKNIAETAEPAFVCVEPRAGTYSVTAETGTMEPKSGTVNYLDYLVFSETVSEPAELACVDGNGNVAVKPIQEPPDKRPVSQVVYPTFDGVSEGDRPAADAIVAQLDALKQAYDSMDWRRVTDLYSPDYEDANGFHREYVSRAWKWWFRRNNTAFLLRQIRQWDFADYPAKGLVRVKMFLMCTAVRRDDQPFGYDGIVRIPRHKGAETVITWACEKNVWRIVKTEPSLPNLEEILWNSRAIDKGEKLIPSVDE